MQMKEIRYGLELVFFRTYVAGLDGIVTLEMKSAGANALSEIHMNVTNLLTVPEVTLATGDVNYEGNVFVIGNVGSGAEICATGDILVGGFVEAAHLLAGGDIMIRQGMNASGEGEIRAAGNVNGCFFESTKIYAEGDIQGDYFILKGDKTPTSIGGE